MAANTATKAANGYRIDPPQAEGDGGIVAKARVYLQPIAAPAPFGLFGFFGSTMVLATWMLGWWSFHGTTAVAGFFLFNAAMGGLVQFAAGLWSFKARDYIASALLTMWGTYWMAWGILQGLGVGGIVTIPSLSTSQPGFAVWFIPLGIATFTGSLAALSPKHGNFPLFALLFTIGVGSLILSVGLWSGNLTWTHIAAYLFIAGAICAWYVGAMVILQSSWRKIILPLGKYGRAGNIPGSKSEYPTQYEHGHPGVRQGML